MSAQRARAFKSYSEKNATGENNIFTFARARANDAGEPLGFLKIAMTNNARERQQPEATRRIKEC